MSKELHILHLEDSTKDAELIRSLLTGSKTKFRYILVGSEKDYKIIMESEKIDVILSDYSLPDYSGSKALQFAREKYPDVPFLFVSGAIAEDVAITAILNGAADYVLKNNLARLVPAILRAVNIQVSISRHNQAEIHLKENEKLLHEAQKLAHLGVWKWDLEADIVIWTEELYHIAGMDPGKPAPTFAEQSEMYTPESWDILQLAVTIAMKNGKAYQLELELKRPDKSIRNVNACGLVRFGENGQVVGLYGTVLDITESKTNEKKLLIANQELAFQSREKGKRAAELILANKELGYQNQEKENRAAELILANKELVFQSGEKEQRAAELILANKELVYQNKEKEKRAAELRLANKELVFQSGEKEKRAAELILANKELLYQNQEKEKRAAEFIEARDNARQSDRLKSAFLANMSHEIRTPMNGILGFTELLKEPDLTNEELQGYVEIIEKSGARLLNIINNIVDISKIESGMMEVDIKELNVNEKIDFIYSFFKSEVETKGIQLSLREKLPPMEAVTKTDSEKLYSILTNLVKNAIKYTNAGSIELGYEKKGDFLEFSVKDTGIGIPKDRQEAIFERFIQADITNKKALQGAGLGLSIAKAYVEMLGGKLWVESEEGKGSIFYFTIPFNP